MHQSTVKSLAKRIIEGHWQSPQLRLAKVDLGVTLYVF